MLLVKRMSMANDGDVANDRNRAAQKKNNTSERQFFEAFNIRVEEILKFMYLWVVGNFLLQIHCELGFSRNNDVE